MRVWAWHLKSNFSFTSCSFRYCQRIKIKQKQERSLWRPVIYLFWNWSTNVQKWEFLLLVPPPTQSVSFSLTKIICFDIFCSQFLRDVRAKIITVFVTMWILLLLLTNCPMKAAIPLPQASAQINKNKPVSRENNNSLKINKMSLTKTFWAKWAAALLMKSKLECTGDMEWTCVKCKAGGVRRFVLFVPCSLNPGDVFRKHIVYDLNDWWSRFEDTNCCLIRKSEVPTARNAGTLLVVFSHLISEQSQIINGTVATESRVCNEADVACLPNRLAVLYFCN